MSSIRPAEPSESLVRASRLSYDELQTALTRVVSFASLEALLQQCLNSPECMEHMDHDLLLSFILGCPQFEIYNLFQQFMDTPALRRNINPSLLTTTAKHCSPHDFQNLLKLYADDPEIEQKLNEEALWEIALHSLGSFPDNTQFFLESLALFPTLQTRMINNTRPLHTIVYSKARDPSDLYKKMLTFIANIPSWHAFITTSLINDSIRYSPNRLALALDTLTTNPILKQKLDSSSLEITLNRTSRNFLPRVFNNLIANPDIKKLVNTSTLDLYLKTACFDENILQCIKDPELGRHLNSDILSKFLLDAVRKKNGLFIIGLLQNLTPELIEIMSTQALEGCRSDPSNVLNLWNQVFSLPGFSPFLKGDLLTTLAKYLPHTIFVHLWKNEKFQTIKDLEALDQKFLDRALNKELTLKNPYNQTSFDYWPAYLSTPIESRPPLSRDRLPFQEVMQNFESTDWPLLEEHYRPLPSGELSQEFHTRYKEALTLRLRLHIEAKTSPVMAFFID